ncbi:cation:proton antiporter [Janthinobacterium sp.]|uniref:cation:proton antiporter n=1 Tax=Janthinobacterium sp. TaxID=1871054 RepID=UPI00293D223B|nr:cation:proton antiporter [Janthinobacterium sp.]
MSPVFFVQALLVVGLPYFLWRCAGLRRLLPLVVVQIIVGILLGPSVFGALAPHWWAGLFDAARGSMLPGLQWLAIALFSFLTGVHLRGQGGAGQGRATLWICAGSIALPLLAGAAGGLWLAGNVGTALAAGGAAWFALAVGVCTAVTALPVLAAILREMRLDATPVGAMALRCAAWNDALIWILLAALLLAHRGAGMEPAAWLPPATVWGAAGAALLLAPPLMRWIGRRDFEPELHLVVALISALGLALAFDLIGLHHVIGAFVAGLIWPRRHASRIAAQIEPLTMVALLPFYFLGAGLRLPVGALSHDALLVFAVTAPLAILAKMAGSAVPARLAGMAWREALALGALLQTKGMVEVVVLGVLLDAGLLGVTAFTGLLLTALATTLLAKPLTACLLRPRPAPRAAVAPRVAAVRF